MTDEKKIAEVLDQSVSVNSRAQVVPTEADLIWAEISNKPIMMFSLPNQKVSDYCRPVPIDPSRCFLLYKAGSVIPAIEAAIGEKFTCEGVERYVIVSRKKHNAF